MTRPLRAGKRPGGAGRLAPRRPTSSDTTVGSPRTGLHRLIPSRGAPCSFSRPMVSGRTATGSIPAHRLSSENLRSRSHPALRGPASPPRALLASQPGPRLSQESPRHLCSIYRASSRWRASAITSLAIECRNYCSVSRASREATQGERCRWIAAPRTSSKRIPPMMNGSRERRFGSEVFSVMLNERISTRCRRVKYEAYRPPFAARPAAESTP